MTPDREFLARLDAAVGCLQCGDPLGDSPSDDFCDAICQQRWHAARSERLVGYQDPWRDEGPDRLPGIGTDAMNTGDPGENHPYPSPALTCRECGRSSDDWHRDLSAPVVYFAEQDLCLRCSLREPSLGPPPWTCNRCGRSTADWRPAGQPRWPFLRPGMCAGCRPEFIELTAHVARTGHFPVRSRWDRWLDRVHAAADTVDEAVFTAWCAAADAAEAVLDAVALLDRPAWRWLANRLRTTAGGGIIPGPRADDDTVPAMLSPGGVVLGFDAADGGAVAVWHGQQLIGGWVDGVPREITPVDEEGNPAGWAGWEQLGYLEAEQDVAWMDAAARAQRDLAAARRTANVRAGRDPDDGIRDPFRGPLYPCTAPGCGRPAALGVPRCAMHMYVEAPAFRLPRQTGNLARDAYGRTTRGVRRPARAARGAASADGWARVDPAAVDRPDVALGGDGR